MEEDRAREFQQLIHQFDFDEEVKYRDRRDDPYQQFATEREDLELVSGFVDAERLGPAGPGILGTVMAGEKGRLQELEKRLKTIARPDEAFKARTHFYLAHVRGEMKEQHYRVVISDDEALERVTRFSRLPYRSPQAYVLALAVLDEKGEIDSKRLEFLSNHFGGEYSVSSEDIIRYARHVREYLFPDRFGGEKIKKARKKS